MNALPSISYSNITTFFEQPKNRKIGTGILILAGAGLTFHSLRHIKATPLFSCSELIVGLSFVATSIWLNSYKKPSLEPKETPQDITYLMTQDVLSHPIEFILTDLEYPDQPSNLTQTIAQFKQKYEARFIEKNGKCIDSQLLADSKLRDRSFYKFIRFPTTTNQKNFDLNKRASKISEPDWIEHTRFLTALMKEFETEVRLIR